MNEELKNQLAEEYTRNVVSSFKIVAGKAYRDGLEKMYELMKENIRNYEDKGMC